MELTAKLKKAIQQHAASEYPSECCGVIVNNKYIACRNTSSERDAFVIHFEDLANAEDLGEIQAYVHSHPDGTTVASDLDLHQIELHKKPWIICAYPEIDFAVYEPCGYQAPLVGRNYHHGWQDCFTIVRDFYKREFAIDMPDFERIDRWWESANSASLYLENYQAAGFIEVSIDDLKYGDVMLCRVGDTAHVNHAVIWLGDNTKLISEETEPCVGSSLILHHPYNRKSRREIFGEMWLQRVEKVVRHVKNN